MEVAIMMASHSGPVGAFPRSLCDAARARRRFEGALLRLRASSLPRSLRGRRRLPTRNRDLFDHSGGADAVRRGAAVAGAVAGDALQSPLEVPFRLPRVSAVFRARGAAAMAAGDGRYGAASRVVHVSVDGSTDAGRVAGARGGRSGGSCCGSAWWSMWVAERGGE